MAGIGFELRKLLKKQGITPRVMITDKLASYGAAKREIMPGVEHRQHDLRHVELRIRRAGLDLDPGWLPWFADIDRQMYFFYAVPMAPFLMMAIALILGDILYKPDAGAERRTLGMLVVCGYLALAITNFAWLFPILTGIPISQSTWDMEMWLPSWC